jgi:hypothetical protein
VEACRWGLRAAIDAIVADAYCLGRADYEHILGSFNHRSFKQAPELCLAAFDELAAQGLEAFCHHRDPYFDIEPSTALAQPVIDLNAESCRQQIFKFAPVRSC